MVRVNSGIVALLLCVATAQAEGSAERLSWNEKTGATLQTAGAAVRLDHIEGLPAIELSFLPDGPQLSLDRPVAVESSPTRLRLTYRLAGPGAVLDVERIITLTEGKGGVAAVEGFTLRSSQNLSVDLEIRRPFAIVPHEGGGTPGLTLPLKNGYAKPLPLGPHSAQAEYRLGHFLTRGEATHLALPVIEFHGLKGVAGALMADPGFSALWEVTGSGQAIAGVLCYRYAGSRVPLAREETRRFGVWLSPATDSASVFAAAIDAFYEQMLPDVPPGPKWLHEIAMVGYDYLSDDGKGWDRDVALLAKWIEPSERRRVALCLHGWYDAIGTYSYDAQSRRIKDSWIAFGPTRKIPLTLAEVRRRLRLARDLGFRVLLYFGDGLASDSGVPGFRDSWVYRDAQGNAIRGWQGPDTYGPTYWLNPAHPEVSAWFRDYLDALLAAWGADCDGFVWDETFECHIGQVATQPEPAYCDRAMLSLVKRLSDRVRAFDPEKVFLASDCQGLIGDVPNYAMMAHGTYQDTACNPAAWPWGLFANWRNVLWSCNWAAISGLENTRYGVETYGVPVAISNGWGDDLGPSEWTDAQRDAILGLFRSRLQQNQRVRYLTTDPLEALRGDPLPTAGEGLVNWALASRGAKAVASSEDAPRYPAAGAIDGVRDRTGWGAGHGWASQLDPRPHWLQVTLPQPRAVKRFVVITYHQDDPINTAQVWGVRDYEIQSLDNGSGEWKTLVAESSGRAVAVRVHDLPHPVEVTDFRILVHRGPPNDGRARILQLEAWGEAAK